MQEKENKNLDEAFANLFGGSSSLGGEEEMLRIASTYSRQITSYQIKCLLFLELKASRLDEKNKEALNSFVKRWLELKQYNNSASFVVRALETISLRKFINENSHELL